MMTETQFYFEYSRRYDPAYSSSQYDYSSLHDTAVHFTRERQFQELAETETASRLSLNVDDIDITRPEHLDVFESVLRDMGVENNEQRLSREKTKSWIRLGRGLGRLLVDLAAGDIGGAYGELDAAVLGIIENSIGSDNITDIRESPHDRIIDHSLTKQENKKILKDTLSKFGVQWSQGIESKFEEHMAVLDSKLEKYGNDKLEEFSSEVRGFFGNIANEFESRRQEEQVQAVKIQKEYKWKTNIALMKETGEAASLLASVLGKESLASDISFASQLTAETMSAIPKILDVHNHGGLVNVLSNIGKPGIPFISGAEAILPFLSLAMIPLKFISFLKSRKNKGKSLDQATFEAIQKLFSFVAEFRQDVLLRFDNLEVMLLGQHQDVMTKLTTVENNTQQLILACDSIYNQLFKLYRDSWLAMRDMSTVRDKLIESKDKFEEYQRRYGDQFIGDLTLTYYLELCKAFMNGGDEDYAVGKLDWSDTLSMSALSSTQPENNVRLLASRLNFHSGRELYNPSWLLNGLEMYLKWLLAAPRLIADEKVYIDMSLERINDLRQFSMTLSGESGVMIIRDIVSQLDSFMLEVGEQVRAFDADVVNDMQRNAVAHVKRTQVDRLSKLPGAISYTSQTPQSQGRHHHIGQSFPDHGATLQYLKERYIEQARANLVSYTLNVSYLDSTCNQTSSPMQIAFAYPHDGNYGKHFHKKIPFPLTQVHTRYLPGLSVLFHAQDLGAGEVSISYRNRKFNELPYGEYADWCSSGDDTANLHTHPETRSVCYLMDAELLITFNFKEQGNPVSVYHLSRVMGGVDFNPHVYQIRYVNLHTYQFEHYWAASFAPQHLPNEYIEYEHIIDAETTESALAHVQRAVEKEIQRKRHGISQQLTNRVSIGSSLHAAYHNFRWNVFLLNAYSTFAGLPLFSQYPFKTLSEDGSAFMPGLLLAIEQGELKEYLELASTELKIAETIVCEHMQSETHPAFPGVNEMHEKLVSLQQEFLQSEPIQAPNLMNEDTSLVNQAQIEKASSDYFDRVIVYVESNPSRAASVITERNYWLAIKAWGAIPASQQDIYQARMSVYKVPLLSRENTHITPNNPKMLPPPAIEDNSLRRSYMADFFSMLARWLDQPAQVNVESYELATLEKTFPSHLSVKLHNYFRHPITRNWIFVINLYEDGRELASVSLYGIPKLCVSADASRSNIYDFASSNPDLRPNPSSALPICEILPPTRVELMQFGMYRGVVSGMTHGAMSVVERTLNNQLGFSNLFAFLSVNTAYASYYYFSRLADYQSLMGDESGADLSASSPSTLAAIDTFDVMLWLVFFRLISFVINKAAVSLEERGWNRTSTSLRYASSLISFGAIATSVAQSPEPVSAISSAAAGAVTQLAISGVDNRLRR